MRERQVVDTSTSGGRERGRGNNLGVRIISFFIRKKKK
jgi:hypothetical protein